MADTLRDLLARSGVLAHVVLPPEPDAVLAALEVTSAPQNLGGGISTGGVTLVHDLSKSLISGSTSGWRSRDRASPSRSSSSWSRRTRPVPGRVPPSFLTAQGRYGGQVDRSEHHQKQPQEQRLTRAAFELAGLSRAEVERLSFA